jgi:hypothetical protein
MFGAGYGAGRTKKLKISHGGPCRCRIFATDYFTGRSRQGQVDQNQNTEAQKELPEMPKLKIKKQNLTTDKHG